MPTERQVLWKGRFLQVLKTGRWEYADRVGATGAVAIVGVTDAGCLLLTEQHRLSLDRRVIELPAGLVGDTPGQESEPMAEAARRELLEETGFEAGEMALLAEGPPSAGLSTEIVSFFHAKRVRRVHEGGGDEAEDIVVHQVPLGEIREWLAARTREGLLVDPKIYAGLYLAGAALPAPPR